MFYLDLFRCLQKHDVRYLLAGGLAMNLHGVLKQNTGRRQDQDDMEHLLRLKGLAP